MGGALWAAWRLLRENDPGGWAVAAGIASGMVVALFDFPLYTPATAPLFWTLAGLAAALARRETAPVAGLARGPRSLVLAATLACAGLLVALPWMRQTVSQAWNRLGWEFSERGKPALAVPCLDRAATVAPNNRQVYELLTTALRRANRMDEASVANEAWIKRDPNQSAAHNTLGTIQGSQGYYDQALVSFRKAARLAPNNVQAHLNAASVYFEQRQNDLGFLSVAAASRKDPDAVDRFMCDYLEGMITQRKIRLAAILADRFRSLNLGTPGGQKEVRDIYRRVVKMLNDK
jgi:tetratricopeptide (TPR) repeat protein